MKHCPDPRDDSGSVILALLMMIVLAALGALLLTASLTQSKTVQRDQSFTTVLPAADAGIQRGLFMLNHGLAAKLPGMPGQPATQTITQGSQSAQWSAAVQATKPPSYLLTATTTTGVTRTLKAVAYQSGRFSYSVFADTSVVFRGGNSSTSYNSATGTTTTTGDGRVGSNGSVVINGGATADGVDLYNWTTDPNTSRCSGGPCPSGYNTYGAKLDISSPAATQFITDQLAACTSKVAYTTSTDADHTLNPGTWCASSLTLDADTNVSGPTTIYVSGNVTMSHHLNINYTSGVTPTAANLQIYMLGTSYDMANHTTIAGAIYAPLATCTGGAQSVVYGSLVCGTLSNVGGWQFHYDDALASVGGGDFRIRNFREG